MTHTHRTTTRRRMRNNRQRERQKESKQQKKNNNNISTASTINTSVVTEMETFKILKMVPYVHRLYASWITESNPLFVRLSLSFTGILFSVLFALIRILHSRIVLRAWTLSKHTKYANLARKMERINDGRWTKNLSQCFALSLSLPLSVAFELWTNKRMLFASKGEKKE